MGFNNIILLSLSAAFVIIGTHMTITQGITFSYPIFMFAVALLFWYKYRKNQQQDRDKQGPSEAKKKKQR